MPLHTHSNLLDSLLHWTREQPDAIYLTQPQVDGSIVDYRWREVEDQARRMAAHLQSLDLPARSHIALLGKNSAHWIMADLAIWMAGHVSVPLYPSLNAETAAYVLEHSDARLLFVGRMDDNWPALRAVIPKDMPQIALPLSPAPELPQWNDIVADCAPLPSIAQPRSEDLATIIYTSGSTGRPKGVMHRHSALMAITSALESTFGYNRQDRMLSYLPLAHVAERAAVEAASLRFGFRVFFSDSLATFAQDLQRAKPTVFFSVPRLWTKFYLGVQQKLPPAQFALLRQEGPEAAGLKSAVLAQLGLQDTRIAITGSAPLPQATVEWYRSLGLEMLDCYGMSENFATSHFSRPGQVRIGYVGSPVPGVEARIADNGELQVRSPGQMLGYYKMAEKTAEEMTADGFFRTGDRGEIDELGRLRITGRVKELFKTAKGKYVAPAPIENRIANHPRIESVCVTGAGEPQPFAVITLAPETQKALEDGLDRSVVATELSTLLEEVNAALEDHEALAYLVVTQDAWTIESGLLTPTLKIRRDVIEARYLSHAERWSEQHRRVLWA